MILRVRRRRQYRRGCRGAARAVKPSDEREKAFAEWLESPKRPREPVITGLIGDDPLEAIEGGKVINRADPKKPGRTSENPEAAEGRIGRGLRLSNENNAVLPLGNLDRDRPLSLALWIRTPDTLNHLADAARDWFNRRPETPLALARRIAEFRQGCSVLILSSHRPLPAEDRAWLVEKCRAWAAKLDAHLAAVEAGQDVMRVRGEADATITRRIDALRERLAESAPVQLFAACVTPGRGVYLW